MKGIKMKKNESGRSMVEMLGVLAIIGVLSVGGIAGYTMAMKKYRVNEAVHAISLAAVTCAAGETDMDDFDNDVVKSLSCAEDKTDGGYDLKYTLADSVTDDTDIEAAVAKIAIDGLDISEATAS